MDDETFESILILIVPEVVKLIVEKFEINEIKATERFYCSKIYEKLECADTKLWNSSPFALFNMFEDEMKWGHTNCPEEV